jgi:hypothetical protein
VQFLAEQGGSELAPNTDRYEQDLDQDQQVSTLRALHMVHCEFCTFWCTVNSAPFGAL